MWTLSSLLALCEGNPPEVDSPHKGLVMRSFYVPFGVSPKKMWNKQPSCRWCDLLSIGSWTRMNKFQWNLDNYAIIFIQENSDKNTVCKNSGHLISACVTRPYRPVSQMPQCTCPISHNTPFRTEMSIFLFWIVHCGTGTLWCSWIWSIVVSLHP